MTMSAPVLEDQTLRRISVSEYHRMIDAGIFNEDDPVELLDGLLVEMTPQGRPHGYIIQQLTKLLIRALGDAHAVLPQLPITLGDYSEPEPDFAIVSAEAGACKTDHPSTALLVIEVARTSLAKDRGVKASLYARFGIPEYWVVDVEAQAIEVRREPDTALGRYTTLTTVNDGSVECGSAPGLSVTLDALFG
jgi:Uma2 family endonuclease